MKRASTTRLCVVNSRWCSFLLLFFVQLSSANSQLKLLQSFYDSVHSPSEVQGVDQFKKPLNLVMSAASDTLLILNEGGAFFQFQKGAGSWQFVKQHQLENLPGSWGMPSSMRSLEARADSMDFYASSERLDQVFHLRLQGDQLTFNGSAQNAFSTGFKGIKAFRLNANQSRIYDVSALANRLKLSDIDDYGELQTLGSIDANTQTLNLSSVSKQVNRLYSLEHSEDLAVCTDGDSEHILIRTDKDSWITDINRVADINNEGWTYSSFKAYSQDRKQCTRIDLDCWLNTDRRSTLFVYLKASNTLEILRFYPRKKHWVTESRVSDFYLPDGLESRCYSAHRIKIIENRLVAYGGHEVWLYQIQPDQSVRLDFKAKLPELSGMPLTARDVQWREQSGTLAVLSDNVAGSLFIYGTPAPATVSDATVVPQTTPPSSAASPLGFWLMTVSLAVAATMVAL